MIDWLSYLTEKIKISKKYRIVVWYDSVIFNGKL